MNKNLKKVISSAAVVAMVASSASAFAATFPDVDASASYAAAVSNLTALGIVQGDDNGLFNPDNTVTRAEFAKMVVESLGEGAAAQAITTSDFADCVGHWGVGYIATGVADGFINGYGDGNFGPNDTVTYAQAVKMLVAAAGYDAFATNAGGYPSGYLSYGSTLNIINGVTGVTNDTALTRAQCAVLVSNALQAPICVQDGFTYGGLTGTVVQPNYVQKDGTGADWQTMLTKFHNAYVVKGRVVNTSRTGNVDPGEVEFQVESADNFDDEYITRTDDNARTETMLVGDTAAEDMFRVYSTAIVQYDDNADEWTILSINPQGSNKTVEVAASMVSEDEGYTDKMYSSHKIPVRKSESSASVTTYKLADDAEVYVNGVKIDGTEDYTLDKWLEDYIIYNATGTVTLIDETEVGSTSTDGYYDCVMITYYADAVVDYTQTTSSNNRIGFKAYDNKIAAKLQWDPENEDVTVTFTKDGAAIDWTEVAEYDVLSIAYDVSGDFASSEFYDVMVAQNTVSGSVTGRDTKDQTVKIDGTQYDLASLVLADELELSGVYTFYLNSFGYVAYVDENESSKNIGVLVGMYETAGGDYPTIRFIDTDGNVVTKEVKDADEANKFYRLAIGENPTTGKTEYAGQDVSKLDVKADIQNMVFEYTMSSGRVRFKSTLNGVGGPELDFKANSSRLGSYSLNESVVKIVDLDSYLNEDGSVGVASVSSFEDEALYTAYLYDRNNNGDYRFCMVLKGTGSINADTAVAVVKASPQQTSVDGETYVALTVAKDGSEDGTEEVTVNVEEGLGAENVAEGDIVIYSVNSNNVVSEFYKVMSAQEDYNNWFNGVTPKTTKDVISASVLEDGAWKWSTESKEVNVYFGPVYQKTSNSIDLFVDASDNTSDIVNENETMNFNVADADTFIYDYSSATKYRVNAGALPNVSRGIYNSSVWANEDRTIVDWNKVSEEGVNPSFAFVKEVDDVVTEVVLFLAK